MSDSPTPSPDPYGQPAQSPYGAAAGTQPGGVGPRIGARIVDFIIVAVVANIVDAILAGGGMYSGDRTYADVAIASVIGAVIYLAYFTLMESSRGQTVGKMLLRLHTEGPGGGRPTTAEAFKRNLWTGLGILGVLGVVGNLVGAVLSIVVIVVLIVQVANDSDGRRTFMDTFAGGTRVVRQG